MAMYTHGEQIKFLSTTVMLLKVLWGNEAQPFCQFRMTPWCVDRESVSFGPAHYESGHKRAAAAWLLSPLACTGLLVLLIPLAAFAQRSCAENPSVRNLIQEGSDTHRSYDERKRVFEIGLRLCRQNNEGGEQHSAVGAHLASELDPLRNCLARADKKCAIEAFPKLRDPKLKDDPEYLDLSAQVMSLEHKQTEALAAIDRAIKMERSGRLIS